MKDRNVHVLVAALLLTPLAAVHAADRPNLVIILADDYGTAAIGKWHLG